MSGPAFQAGPPAGGVTAGLKPGLLRGGAITLGAQLLKALLQIGGLAVLSRLLPPEVFGLLAMVTALSAILMVFRDLGLSAATIQRAEITEDQVTALFWVNVGFGALTAVVFLVAGPLIGRFYHRTELGVFVAGAAAATLFSALGAQHQALLSRQFRFSRIAMADVASVFCAQVIGIVMAWRGAGPLALATMPAVAAGVSSAGLWLATGWVPGRPRWERTAGSMIRFGAHLTGFNLANYFARNLDNILIGRYAGPAELGFYSRSYQLLLLPLQQINTPVSSVAVPALSRLVDDPARYRAAYRTILSRMLFLCLPLVAFSLAAAHPIIRVAFGPGWDRAAELFAILGILGLAQPVTFTSSWLFVSQGRGAEMMRWGLIGGVLSVIAIVAGLPWGTAGVAYSYAVSGLLVRTPLLIWYVGRSGPVGVRDILRTSVAPGIVAAIVFGATALTAPLLRSLAPLNTLVALGAVGGASMLGGVLLMDEGRELLRDCWSLLRSFGSAKVREPRCT